MRISKSRKNMWSVMANYGKWTPCITVVPAKKQPKKTNEVSTK